ncbi:MAG: hypothetical protein F4Y86_07570 [Gammaproteobacteria bacterium]|nr:hypothetical protein [Gammaproteobacteria bacterium]
MTKGIKIEWHYPGTERISEIEHLYGIDVDNLAEVPSINAVPSYWPKEDKIVEYNVEVDRECRPRWRFEDFEKDNSPSSTRGMTGADGH